MPFYRHHRQNLWLHPSSTSPNVTKSLSPHLGTTASCPDVEASARPACRTHYLAEIQALFFVPLSCSLTLFERLACLQLVDPATTTSAGFSRWQLSSCPQTVPLLASPVTVAPQTTTLAESLCWQPHLSPTDSPPDSSCK